MQFLTVQCSAGSAPQPVQWAADYSDPVLSAGRREKFVLMTDKLVTC